jgi:hypothetical protein
LLNTASGLIIVLTSRACWLNWGMQSWRALRCHIGSWSWLRVMGNQV